MKHELLSRMREKDMRCYLPDGALWPVLANLAELQEERGNAAEAESLRREARRVIEYIADHADALGLREVFTSTPRVRAVLDAIPT